MSNELLFLLSMVLELSVVVLLFWLFGRAGMYLVISYAIILCNMQVFKSVDMFGMGVTLGNTLYASIFLASDILAEYYGKSAARQGVFIGFAALLISTLYMWLSLQFTPNASDTGHPHLAALFTLTPWIALASMVAYMSCQLLDVFMYVTLKEWTAGKALWLRNNLSTLTSQALDTVVFTAIATYAGIFPEEIFWNLVLVSYAVKAFIALCDTPFLYLTKLRRAPDAE